ncbi:dd4abbea-2081-4c19-b808-f2f55b6d0643 [Sclerotinia trifoliorum]|uniref:Dd4abbea-2081-4c19-b808-f2f55b6d0643 n=1 Tax=Sclerotinia trifoliorum TaxID=28548 RepID=A0A8H2W1E2_9HELO|nr:dd4abbea-2081-4c19-b808-f2f55b6d0643 [Sclerotinia trifoliorum]
MAPLAPIFKKAYFSIFFGIFFYALALIALTNPWLQRHVMYVHKLRLPQAWATDIDKPERFGFAKNQVSPFNFSTPDGETLYAWHIMPLGLYAKHEPEILEQPSGFVDDITLTKGFELLKDDPDARLIINFHGTFGNVAQGERTGSYRAIPDGSTSNIHILAIDYRGFGRSTGFPTEEGLITDGIAAVDWAMKVAKVPSSRIVVLGQSLGTAVACGVIEHFSLQGIEFAGVVLVAGFTDVSNLLTSYSIAGWIPLLSPLRPYPALQKLFISYLNDKWPSTSRLTNFVKISKRVRLFIIHALDDYEIPWYHSQGLFAAAANGTMDSGIDMELLEKMKARNTINMGDGAFISTWKTGNDKIIRQEVVGHGAHSTVLTYAPLSLAVFKAFGFDNGGVLP